MDKIIKYDKFVPHIFKAKDNKTFEDDEVRKQPTKTLRINSDVDLNLKPNSRDEEDDQEQPVFIYKDQASCAMVHSTAPDLFIEFDFLHFNQKSNTYCWVEGSRWLIYEEDYDIELRRFGSPHLSTMSIKGLKSFKKVFKHGDLSLDDNGKSYLDILTIYSDYAAKSGCFTNEELMDIRKALTLNHYHSGMHLPSHSYGPPAIHYSEERRCFELADYQGPPLSRTRSRRGSSIILGDINRVQSNKKLEECLHQGTEGLLVQVGILDSIREIHSMFIRMETPIVEEGLMDIQCPLRFMYFIFGPKSREAELMEEFREAAYHMNSSDKIIEASKKFVNSSALIHLNKRINADTLAHCLPHLKNFASRITAETHKRNMDKRMSIKDDKLNQLAISHREDKYRSSMTITSTGLESDEEGSKCKRVMKQFFPPFHQVYLDLKGMKSRYLSDYRDAFSAENASVVFTGIIFVYFVVLSPAITFGALFNSLVSPKMTITMLLVASGTYQTLYVMLSGQPLEIVGVTPTMFVVEQVLATLSKEVNTSLEVMRFWIGVYVSSLGLIFTMFNGAVIVQHFRRSVEEVYNTYFSTIFILSALFTMFKALPYTSTNTNNLVTVNATVFRDERRKFGVGGTTLFLALVMLNFCLYLVKINRGIYLRRSIRKMLGAFNVPLGIILIIALNLIFFYEYDMPILNIPPSNNINLTLWVNFPPFADISAASGSVHVFCFCVGVSMFFMLIVEVATNSISVAKAERRLNKPIMYSINFLIIIVLFPLASIFLGWPFFSGAMVRSNAHCMAMAKWSANTVPGVPKQIIGEAEQRVSGMIVGILVFVSVFLGSALRYIPMASMYGMFLYMGVMGISDMVLWKRLINLLRRRKHWRDRIYLKDIPTWNVRVLVAIQIFFVIVLMILYILSQFTIYVWTLFLFPIFVGMYAILRGYILPLWPRLNTHLSKMDKKHVVKLFTGDKEVEFITDIKDHNGKKHDSEDMHSKSDSESDIY